jgi:hypothetical protein
MLPVTSQRFLKTSFDRIPRISLYNLHIFQDVQKTKAILSWTRIARMMMFSKETDAITQLLLLFYILIYFIRYVLCKVFRYLFNRSFITLFMEQKYFYFQTNERIAGKRNRVYQEIQDSAFHVLNSR